MKCKRSVTDVPYLRDNPIVASVAEEALHPRKCTGGLELENRFHQRPPSGSNLAVEVSLNGLPTPECEKEHLVASGSRMPPMIESSAGPLEGLRNVVLVEIGLGRQWPPHMFP